MKRFYFLLFFIVLIFSNNFHAQNKFADLVIINAKIRTLNSQKPTAEAVAVSKNKILHVGTNSEIQTFSNDKTKVIDAKGNLVIPGFNDAHVHFLNMGTQFFSMNLRTVENEAEFIEKLKYYTEFLPKGVWILGSGWNADALKFSKETKVLIDKISAENPLFIYGLDVNSAIINSKSLAVVSKNKSAEELKKLGFEFDKDGNSNGVMRGAAIQFVKNFAPRDALADKFAVAEAATNYAARFGVTSAQDMQLDDNLELYRELQKRGKMKTRIYDCFPLPDRKKYVSMKISRQPSAEMARGGCFKFFTEGEDDDLKRLYGDVEAADAAGWQVMLHAIGKQANSIALDIFEKVSKTNGAKDRRFRIEHAHDFRLPEISRFKNLGVIPSMQPYLFYGGVFDQTEPYRALIDAKVFPAFGSDSFMIEVNPLLGIYAAIIKTDELGEAAQAVTVEEAVRAYTIGAAYAEFQEEIKGTISKDKLADLVILSKDIFAAKPEEILQTKVLMTIVDGKIVYQSQ